MTKAGSRPGLGAGDRWWGMGREEGAGEPRPQLTSEFLLCQLLENIILTPERPN